MKKIIFILVLIAITFTSLPTAVTYAVTKVDESPVAVTGKVTNNSLPVSGAIVSVKCEVTTVTATTNSNGTYAVIFNNPLCLTGDTVTVTATSGSLIGSNSALVIGNSCNTNVIVVNVSVPEFGILTTLSASVISGGAFIAVRRRSQGEN